MTIDGCDKLTSHFQSYLPVAPAKSSGIILRDIVTEVNYNRLFREFCKLFGRYWNA